MKTIVLAICLVGALIWGIAGQVSVGNLKAQVGEQSLQMWEQSREQSESIEQWEEAYAQLMETNRILDANCDAWSKTYEALKAQNEWYKRVLIETYGWRP